MSLDWSPLVELFRRSQRPLLTTHVRPDADGLGSQLALADALRGMGKAPRVVIASKLPPRYDFLDPGRTVIENFQPPGDAFRSADAVVVMDTGTWGQLGEFGAFLKSYSGPKAVVDHHRTQDDLGGLAFVDTSAEATGRLTYEIIRALGVPLSPAAAKYLFAALATDTGWFRHPNTTPATFALAEELMRHGATPTPLYEALYETAPVARLKLHGVALSRLATRANGRIAYTEIYLTDYPQTGAVPGDTEDLINYPRSVQGVEVALLFIEQADGGTKVSFRARTVDVSKVAESFQGGGHKLAAGARLPDALTESREKVIGAVEAAMAHVC
ncbi:MAG TPA: bifunctional oligoribonuclease/PAP phosphatase NrnA [Fimbriiglobus sp.]|jgi:phosphoesterase RecJ-like protein